MKILAIPVCLASLALVACAPQPETTRSAMSFQSEIAATGPAASATEVAARPQVQAQYQTQYDVQMINVIVPQSLRASEANTFRPNADIVWHGDALGDRHAQVKAIFETAMARGTASMHQGRKVVMTVEVTRFHCVTEKTRYTVGGVHDLRFILTLRDAETGEVLQGPRLVNADTHAAGGARAIAEDAAGRTQKVVVTERLAEVIARELATPVAAPDSLAVTRMPWSPAKLSFIE
ncbi:MAG: DUF6778 family protein [Cypionkella sp.]